MRYTVRRIITFILPNNALHLTATVPSVWRSVLVVWLFPLHFWLTAQQR
jgi:hypothetical protein